MGIGAVRCAHTHNLAKCFAFRYTEIRLIDCMKRKSVRVHCADLHLDDSEYAGCTPDDPFG